MSFRAVVRSWLRVKGLDCINRNKTWVTTGGRKNEENKKCLLNCCNQWCLTWRRACSLGMQSHKEWWVHAAHKFDKVKPAIFSKAYFFFVVLGAWGFLVFFWQCKLLLLCELWASLLRSVHFSSMKNIHFDIFGIMPPISTSSANGGTDFHIPPFILNH